MAALLIRDGVPYWWLSPDIWVVPGPDPDGAPGLPSAGQPAFVWARVANQSRVELANVEIRFHWSNPATGVLRSNSTLIGTSFATIAAGGTVEVLCVSPWVPVSVSNGHVCLVAEAIHPADALPQPLPDPFAPPAHNQVAQRNIDLVSLAPGMMRMMAIELAAPVRHPRHVIITVERARVPLDKDLLPTLGLTNYRFTPDLPVELALLDTPELDCRKFPAAEKLERKLAAGDAGAVHVALRAGKLPNGVYGLVHVLENDAATGTVTGGVSLIIIAARRTRAKPRLSRPSPAESAS